MDSGYRGYQTPSAMSDYRGYRAPTAMVSWALHRLSGIGVLVFLLLHILDIFIIGYGPKDFNDLLFLYHNPVFRIGEVILIAGVYYHAYNGVRILLIDFWPKAFQWERQLFYGVIGLFIVSFVPSAYFMIRPMF
ncbi:MAG TPA: succinate dehydrogenase, cytochrome b556 subunit [Thermomicrobiaceae bacterium]|nr:succinate dehydrogenase, cytochrome b556 subunit [Thermomicrobiaceae bacterium]